MNIAELRARLEEIRARLEELAGEAETRSLTDEETGEVDTLMAEFDEKRGQLVTLEERQSRLDAIRGVNLGVDNTRGTEPGEDRSGNEDRGTFRTNAASRIPDNIHDLEEYRTREPDPERRADLLVDGARRWIDGQSFPNQRHSREQLQENVDRLLVTAIGDKDMSGRESVARRLLLTGSPEYGRAFGRMIARGNVDSLPAEERELLTRSLSTTQSGYAVPAQIDPTVLLVSDGAANPFRGMARVVTITSDVWKGITSAAITASYDAEAAEVSDDTPTLAQPSIDTEKAQSLVTFSIESAQDWTGLQAEMATEFADAKDVLEEAKFTTGAGHASNEPQGIITGATIYATVATSVTPALVDLYTVQGNLPARWDRDASWLMHKKVLGKFQQLAIANGGLSSVWGELSVPGPSDFLGASIYKGSTIDSAYGTAAKKIAVYGSFKRAFVIVDRVGMSVELVPHIFNTANNLPDGRRGLYAYWRNSSGVLEPKAFVVLKSS